MGRAHHEDSRWVQVSRHRTGQFGLLGHRVTSLSALSVFPEHVAAVVTRKNAIEVPAFIPYYLY